MRKIFLLLSTPLILFFAIYAFLVPKHAHALGVPDAPKNLSASFRCGGTTGQRPFIDFKWTYDPNISGPDLFYFITIPEAGVSDEMVLDLSTGAYVLQVPQEPKTYNWNVYVKNIHAAVDCCSVKTPGLPITTRSCIPDGVTPTPVPPNLHNNDCANRSEACKDLEKYPADHCSDAPYDSTWFDCSIRPGEAADARCPMDNTSSSDDKKWTHSCAYSKDIAPPATCNKQIGDPCNGTYGTTANCCSGQVCANTTGNVGQFGDGTCKKSSDYYLTNAPLSRPCSDADNNDERGRGCVRINTAFGSVSTDSAGFTRWVLGFVLSISGGIVVIIIIISGYRLMTSSGDPEKVKNARDQLTAAVVGLLFIIFSLVILELITKDVLGLPGFGG